VPLGTRTAYERSAQTSLALEPRPSDHGPWNMGTVALRVAYNCGARTPESVLLVMVV